MSPTIPVTTFLLVFSLAVGCSTADADSAVGPKPSGTTAAQRDKAEKEEREAAKATQDYADADKAEFIDEKRKRLVEIQAELDQLSAKGDRSSGAVKADATTTRKAMGPGEEGTRSGRSRPTGSDRNDAKGGFQKRYGELKDAFNKIRQ
jgi:hypothetical protein